MFAILDQEKTGKISMEEWKAAGLKEGQFFQRVKAFLIMVVLATLRLSNMPPAQPPSSRISGLPNLFGVCVYSFMCHHSLPGLFMFYQYSPI